MNFPLENLRNPARDHRAGLMRQFRPSQVYSTLEISKVLEAGRGMRLVDSNPNRFIDSNSASMIEFHAYDVES